MRQAEYPSTHGSCFTTVALLSLLIACAWPLPKALAQDKPSVVEKDPGFVSLFDGKSLEGWHAEDMSYWSVKDGAITGIISAEHPLARNYYLVWQGGKLADFELVLRHRVLCAKDELVNCGFQFRSEMFDGEIKQDCKGYQVDNQTKTPWLVRLYDEWGRHDLALRGESTVFEADGAKKVSPLTEAAGEAWFRLDEWHEYHLICRGNRITLKIDGKLAAEVVDGDPNQADLSGILGLQLHSGPPMTVQFKDIFLKKLQ